MFLAANWQTYTAYPVLCPFFVLALYVMHSKRNRMARNPNQLFYRRRMHPKDKIIEKRPKCRLVRQGHVLKGRPPKKKVYQNHSKLDTFSANSGMHQVGFAVFFFKIAFLHLVVLIEHACY